MERAPNRIYEDMTEEDIDHMLQETRAQGGGARGGDWGSDLFKDRKAQLGATISPQGMISDRGGQHCRDHFTTQRMLSSLGTPLPVRIQSR